MRKKVIGILVMTLMIATAVLPLANSQKIALNNDVASTLVNDDKLDQQQTQGSFSKIPSDITSYAQSFKPTLRTLTRVEIETSGKYKCSIRENLNGPDLTYVTEDYSQAGSHFYDFPDITVIPEDTYYIVLIPQNEAFVCYGENTPYTRGDLCTSEDLGNTWSEPLNEDLKFKTYGYDGTVYNINRDRWFNWIQDAIYDVDTINGDIIEAYDPETYFHPTGEYVENIIVDKTLTITAAPGCTPVVDGNGAGTVLMIWGMEAPNTIIMGLKIQNGDFGISTKAADCIFADNIITSISNDGIAPGDNNIIKNNEISLCNGEFGGIRIRGDGECQVENNYIHNCFAGIFLEGTKGNIIFYNHIEENTVGIVIRESCTGTPSTCNDITSNFIILNHGYGIDIQYGNYGNVIYNNYFENDRNAKDKGDGNTWNLEPPKIVSPHTGEQDNIIGGDLFGGNYWHDYTGSDNNDDGLGDTDLPYNCSEGINLGGDYHPLVYEGGSDLEAADEDLNWADIPPGGNVSGKIIITNAGDEGSALNWEITEYPEWGKWSFSQLNGRNLKPEDGPVQVEVEVEAPDEKDEEFEGNIKIINLDDPDDYEIITVSLVTPKNKEKILSQPLLRILQKFPAIFEILQRFLTL